jgi:putative transposase
MCRVLSVSVSGFYAWRKRPASNRSQSDAALAAKIHAIHERSRGNYGSPRIQAELAEAGDRHSRKRIARLMRAGNLRGVCRRRFVVTTTRGDEAPATDLVERQFVASAPNRLWVADITYVPTAVGFLYLAIVLDVFSRRVVGWSMATHLKTSLVLAALEMAVLQRRPDDVIHHSDHGTQYTSIAFGQRCQHHGVTPSMGSVGDAYDNAMAESFFATLECELLARHRFATPAEARSALFDYIEGFYNPKRRHSALGYRSPVAYERAMAS